MNQEIWFQKYRVEKRIASGGSSQVVLARHLKLNEYCAIKCIQKHHPLYPLQQKEARILRNLKHSDIPILYDIEEDDNCSYLVEQYFFGETLDILYHLENGFSEDKLLMFAIHICNIISYLHSQDPPLLYLDLKPENIIVCEGIPKLIDFGSAIYERDQKANTIYLGTKEYAAPELIDGRGAKKASDIYSIGRLMLFMLSGAVKDIIPRVISTGLKEIIDKCLEKKVKNRYASVEQLRNALMLLYQTKKERLFLHQTSIAVAGAQKRIGVTHISLALASCISRQNTCVYMEKNSSDVLYQMEQYEDIKHFPFRSKNLKFQTVQKNEDIGGVKQEIVVKDLGMLTKENKDEFLAANLRILILGGKPWELSMSEQVLRLLEGYEGIHYCFNLIDRSMFCKLCTYMEKEDCFFVPYEVNVLRLSETDELSEFIRHVQARESKS